MQNELLRSDQDLKRFVRNYVEQWKNYMPIKFDRDETSMKNFQRKFIDAFCNVIDSSYKESPVLNFGPKIKVHDILRRCRRPPCSFQRICPIMYVLFYSKI